MCPRSSDPFHIVTYYIKWVPTSWTHNIVSVKNISFKVSVKNIFFSIIVPPSYVHWSFKGVQNLLTCNAYLIQMVFKTEDDLDLRPEDDHVSSYPFFSACLVCFSHPYNLFVII